MSNKSILDYADDATNTAAKLEGALYNANWRDAMRALRACNEALMEIAPLLVERGVHEGMTQKRMADLLGVPASTLRGAKAEFGRG
jgi:ABC-type lipoprotein release transport system permease subunit